MSRFVEDIRQARRQGKLPRRFRGADVKKACPGWARSNLYEFPSQASARKPRRL